MLVALASLTPLQARDAFATAATMHRGMNVLGYDPMWEDPAKARFQPKHFKAIHKAGFDFVRVVLQSFKHMDPANRLDPRWLAQLDRVIGWAHAAQLTVILDEHDFNVCAEDANVCRSKLEAFWTQIGARYSREPDTMLFELLNEPHGELNGTAWNELIADILPIIRRTNPDRTIIIGPSHWNSLNDLPLLDLPQADRNILVTFHYYEPFSFTHQGAPWTDQKGKSGIVWGSDGDRARLKADFDKVAAWSAQANRPVMLGEFGAYDKSGTPVPLRAAYDDAVARQAEAHRFPWAYWQFDSDFIAYDIDRNTWVKPVRDALIPRP